MPENTHLGGIVLSDDAIEVHAYKTDQGTVNVEVTLNREGRQAPAVQLTVNGILVGGFYLEVGSEKLEPR